MSERWLEHTVTPDEAGRTVQEVLTGVMGVSRRMIQKLTRARGITLNRQPAFLARKLRAGDRLAARVGFDETPALEQVEMPLSIVWEDDALLVLDKPPFVLVHPTAPQHRATLAHGVAHHLAARGVRAKVRPVHRIDRETSGLVLFALTPMANQRLDAALRAGEVERSYLAVVNGEMEEDEGMIEEPIGRDPRNPQLRAVRPDGDPARTHWRVRQRLRGATLLELQLDTGRTHQIRVHLNHAGHPVLGDRQYGRVGTRWIGRQALHAARLAFPHPDTGARVEVEAPLPGDIQALLARLAP